MDTAGRPPPQPIVYIQHLLYNNFMPSNPFIESESRLTFMLQGITGLGLTAREWNEGNGVHIAAVGLIPERINPDVISDAQFVANSLPGIGETRVEALHAAFMAWQDQPQKDSNVTVEVVERELHDPAMLQFVFQSLKKVAINR